MADIYAFPTGTPSRGRLGMSAAMREPVERPDGVPDEVWFAVESVRMMDRIPDVTYREIPVPSTLADFGIGVEVECGQSSDGISSYTYDADMSPHTASGWIMVLYSTTRRRDWDSQWRCVAFARMPLDGGERDCLVPSMYWDDMCAHLESAEPGSIGGTVTVTRNTSFGTLANTSHAGCEIRASWTPCSGMSGVDAGEQVTLWSRFIRSAVPYAERSGEAG